MNLNSRVIFNKAIERYYRDAERIGRLPPAPATGPETAVNMRTQEVKLRLRDGRHVSYSFKLTSRGHLRFRPLWEN